MYISVIIISMLLGQKVNLCYKKEDVVSSMSTHQVHKYYIILTWLYVNHCLMVDGTHMVHIGMHTGCKALVIMH